MLELEKKWPVKKGEKYVLSGEYPYIQLNQKAFEAAHLSELEAETAAARRCRICWQSSGDEFAVKRCEAGTPAGRAD